MPRKMPGKKNVGIEILIVTLPLCLVALDVETTPRFLEFYVEVQQSHGHVTFEFYRPGKEWLPENRIPVEVLQVDVHSPGGASFWIIVSPRRYPPISRLTYGEIPPGFTQLVPYAGPAPPLQVGKEYAVSALGGDTPTLVLKTFVYKGP